MSAPECKTPDMQENPYVLGFTAGELSPWLSTRFDLQAYHRGAALLKNFLVQPYGGIRRRVGTRYVGRAKDQYDGAVRLFPFRYSERDVLMLELYPGGMRVYQDGALLTGDDGEPYEISLPWDSGDVLAELDMMQVNDVVYVLHEDYPPAALYRYGDTHWEYAPLNLDPYPRETLLYQDGKLLVQISSDGSMAQLENNSSVGFTSDMAGKEVILADAEVASRTVLLGKTYELQVEALKNLASADLSPGVTYYVYDEETNLMSFYYCRTLYRSSMYNGSTSPLDYPHCFLAGAMILDEYLSPFEVCGDWSLETYGEWNGTWELWRSYDTTDTNADFTQWDWERLHTFYQGEQEERKNWAFSGSESKPCRMVLVCKSQDVATIPAMLCFRIHGGTRPYKLKITSVINSKKALASVESRYLDRPKMFSTRSWSFGAFGARNGYPSFCQLHQGRLWMGGTKGQPTTLFASAVDDYSDFGTGSLDDDALHLTLAVADQSRICWICAAKSLLVGTSISEWTLSASNGGAITASNAMFNRQSSVGSDAFGAHGVENTVFYIQRGGKRLREISYKLEADGFTSTDTSLLAAHLFESGVKEWAVQRGTNTQLWVLMKDGTLAVLTTNIEQQVTAWQRVSFDGREVLHLAALPSLTSHEDEVWFVTRNLASREISIERMAYDNGFLDGVTHCGSAEETRSQLNCPHLAGMTGRAYLKGYPERGADVRFTATGRGFLLGLLPVDPEITEYEVGLYYSSELQTMSMEQDSSYNAVRQLGRVKLRVQESDPEFEYRSSLADTWEEYEPSRDGISYPHTGAIRLSHIPSPGVGQGFCLRYGGSLDFQLLSLVMEVDYHGR